MHPETVLAKVSAYAPVEHVEQLRQTLSQAEHAFHNSLLPHNVTLTRPINVANILAEWKIPVPFMEIAVWSAALPIMNSDNREALLSLLGEERTRIAIHLISFMSLLRKCRQQHDACEMKLPVLSMLWSEDFFILVVAMFLDALNHSAHSHKLHDKKEIALQARTIFDSILSEHLGLHSVQKDLRDLVFLCEDAQAFTEMKTLIDDKERTLRTTIETIEGLVKSKAEECGISDVNLSHHPTHPYRLKRLKQKGRPAFCDLVSFVALLPDEDTCYRFLRPLQKLGDAYPDPDGYHPLHIRISIKPYGPVNFYIRTPQEDQDYKFGVLHRWQNGEMRLFENVTDLILPRTSRITVYSKNGEPYFLPHHSTPVDLAYKMNEMTGHSYSRAYVFGKDYVKSNYQLEDGDFVEIITGYHTEPDPTWLETVQTQEARKFIRQWQTRHESNGKGNGRMPKVPPLSQQDRDITEAVSIPSGYEGKACHRCIHCKPYPPQLICAYVTHHGLTIHQTACPRLPDHIPPIRIKWRPSHIRSASRTLTIEAFDHKGLLRDIFQNLAPFDINIIKLHAESRTDATARISISLHEENPELVDNICHTLYNMKAVQSVDVDQPQDTNIGPPYTTRTNARINNPYTAQPVTNPHIFFGRRNEMQSIWRALENGGHQSSILFWGQQHIGKTSLLRHLEARILEDSDPYYVPALLSMHGWQQLERTNDLIIWFTTQIHQSLTRLLADARYQFQLPKLNHSHFMDNPATALDTYLSQLQHALTSQQLIIIVDEFQGVRQAPANQGELLLHCLEYVLEKFHNISFIFAGSGQKNLISQRLQQLATIIPLDTLDPQSAEELIRRPVSPLIYESGVVEKIKALTHCHPYYIQLICGKIIEHAISQPVTKQVLTERDFVLAVDTLLSPNSSIFSHLLAATTHGEILLNALVRLPALSDRYVETRSLQHQLQKILSPKRIYAIVDELTELDVLEQSKKDSNLYRIRLPLFQHWLINNSHHF